MTGVYRDVCRVVPGDSNATACSVQREEGRAAHMAARDCDGAKKAARARQAVRSSQQRFGSGGSRRADRGRSGRCRLAGLRLAGGMAESGREHKDVGRLKKESCPVACG